ncbi:hypothetical protein PPACK8108_LOCUS7712 [Phakopsora pachyrhizi]|uniref:Uncharacterized protein n=1 Tax=Phakopsora pachyrhizi TaxID=170000 RepID=A0AAV0AVG4_PHAPC|nr:hypothetical protein PPACK8108_LOCUS7712 [Phakopsora pachyrhizi]
MLIEDLNAINWREQDSIADDAPIKIDMSNEAMTKVEITMIGSEYSLDASTDENKKMNLNLTEERKGWDQGVELVIKAENQVERGYVLEMDCFEIEFDESCLVVPTTQEEINMVTGLPKKTVFRVHYVPRTLTTKRLAEWLEREGQIEESAMPKSLGLTTRGSCMTDGSMEMRIDDKRTEEQRIQDKEDKGLPKKKEEKRNRARIVELNINNINNNKKKINKKKDSKNNKEKEEKENNNSIKEQLQKQ